MTQARGASVFWLIAIILFVHGVAHLPGFAVPWKLVTSSELPYKTTVLAGHLNVGDTGIRLLGLLWLLVATLMILVAAAWLFRLSWAASLTVLVAGVSLVLCLIELPQAWLGVAVNVALLVATPWLGGTAWRYTTDRVIQALVPAVEAAEHPAAAAGDQPVATALPAPVQRYFARALPPGQRPIVSAALRQDAEFFVGGGWKPLTASQYMVTEPPGFLWDARIAMGPGMPVFVRDSYIRGTGSMHGEFAGVFPIVNQSGHRMLDSGALSRYVAEAVWLPTALRHGPHVAWSAIDERHALLTFTDGELSIRARFRFTDDGDIEEIHVADRPRERDGEYIPTPWTVRCQEQGTFDGIRIPVRCSVEWQMPDGPMPYWRGRITSARYTY